MSRVSRLAGAALLLAGAATARLDAYELIGIRWPGGVADFRINPNLPATAGTTEQQIEILRCAARSWRDQSRADFELNYEGTTTRTGYNERDGVNVISFVGADGGDALAATLVNGRNGVATTFDIVFFGSTGGVTNRWSGPGEPDAGEFDVQGVAVHELGHALGLDHSSVAQATMFASASGRALGMRTLHADDRAGIEALYGLRTQDAPAVAITSVTPASGPAEGGNEVVIEGINFTYDSESQLYVDGIVLPGGLWNIESCTRLRVLSMPPVVRPGAVSLRLVNSIGSRTVEGAYTYVGVPPTIAAVEPSEGPLAGGIPITIEGSGFFAGAVFTVGDKPLLQATVINSTTARGTLPPGDDAGPVDIRVVAGGLEGLAAGAFSYTAHVLAAGSADAVAGGEPVPVLVRATTPDTLAAASFGIVYSPALLAVDRVSVEGTEAAAAELVTVDVDNAAGVATVELLMDASGASPFPAGADLPLARIEVVAALAAAPGTRIPLLLRGDVGEPPVALAFLKAEGASLVRPFASDGQVTVTSAAVTFIRGDSNGDGRVDLADPIFELELLFKGGSLGPCADAADANDDGELDVADAVAILLALFRGANALPPPFPAAGVDPSADALGCDG